MSLSNLVQVDSPTAKKLVDTSGKTLVGPDETRCSKGILTSWNYTTSDNYSDVAIVALGDDGVGALHHTALMNCIKGYNNIKKIKENAGKILNYWLRDELDIEEYEKLPEGTSVQVAVLGVDEIVQGILIGELRSLGVRGENISHHLVEDNPFFNITLDTEKGILYKVEYSSENIAQGVYRAEFE